MNSDQSPQLSQKGFTLIELMQVVSIIGVLSAVAVPNFKRYQAKSKTSEAKIQLAAAYTAQEVFYAHFGVYTTYLGYAGYYPAQDQENRYYTVGFNTPNSISRKAFDHAERRGMYSDTDGCLKDMPPTEGMSYFSAGKENGDYKSDAKDLIKSKIGDQSTEENQTYTIEAVGVVSSDFIRTEDMSRITVNQLGALTVESPGY